MDLRVLFKTRLALALAARAVTEGGAEPPTCPVPIQACSKWCSPAKFPSVLSSFLDPRPSCSAWRVFVTAVASTVALAGASAQGAPSVEVPAERDATAAGSVPVVTPGAATKAPQPASESVDDQARFLAGMPVSEDSPLKSLEQTDFWKAYARGLDADWQQLHEQRLDPMSAWSASVLAPKIDLKAPVFYLFGGPDFLSVAALYPDAPVYLLGGLEPLGKVPRLSGLSPQALAEDMHNLRLSLNSILRLSFFKTNDMRDDLIRTELRGVLPLLYLFVARSDARLLDQTRVEIDAQGDLKVLGENDKCLGIPGVRLRIQRRGHPETQDVFYFKHNVEDSVIRAGPGFYAFFKRYSPANSYLKAASFLLHRPQQFGLTRAFLCENSRSVLQDDSGLPFDLFSKDTWDLTLFGTYLRPRPPFTNRLQPDMVEAFKAGPVVPLPFLTGYRHSDESNLVLAIRRVSSPAPLPAEEAEATLPR